MSDTVRAPRSAGAAPTVAIPALKPDQVEYLASTITPEPNMNAVFASRNLRNSEAKSDYCPTCGFHLAQCGGHDEPEARNSANCAGAAKLLAPESGGDT